MTPLNLDYIGSFQKLLSQRRYRTRTISSYVDAVESLFSFYKTAEPSEISFAQVSDFIAYLLNRKKASPVSVNLHLSAFTLFYNALLNKNIDFQSLRPRRSQPKTPEIFSPDEVHRFLSSTVFNIKQRAMLSLIYSAGLELSQAIQLRVQDINLANKEIKIRNSEDEIIRVALLADKLIPELQDYLTFYRPKIWFFEGKKQGVRYSMSAIQRVFKKGLQEANIPKKLTVRSLKYSYVKHMEMYGVSLPIVLKNMGINNSGSVYFYSQMGLSQEELSFSPLDRSNP